MDARKASITIAAGPGGRIPGRDLGRGLVDRFRAPATRYWLCSFLSFHCGLFVDDRFGTILSSKKTKRQIRDKIKDGH